MRTYYSCLIFVLSTHLANAQVADYEYNIEEIVSEAKKLDHSKQYNEWKAKEDTIYKWYVFGSKRGFHVYPDSPSFEATEWYYDSNQYLRASLAYYYLRIKKNEDNTSLLKAYLEAITLSKDTTNRLDLMLYFSNEENRPKAMKDLGPGWWNNYISASATMPWVNHYLEQNLNDKSKESDLSWTLVRNHAQHLSKSNRIKAYSQLKSINFVAPKNGTTKQWELLFKLDPNQAIDDLLSFWDMNHPESNFYITVVLNSTVPNEFSESSAQKGVTFIDSILQNTPNFNGLGNDYFIPQLHTISFLIDPIKGKDLLKKQINEQIKGNSFDFNKYYKRFNTAIIFNFLHNLDFNDNTWLMDMLCHAENLPIEITFPAMSHLFNRSTGMFQSVMLYLRASTEHTEINRQLYEYGLKVIADDLHTKNAMLTKIKSGQE